MNGYLWHLSAQDITIHVDFRHGDTLVAPTAGSVYYTLRDKAGVAVVGHTNVNLPDQEGTGVDIPLPALVNTLTTPGTFEARYLQVGYQWSGGYYSQHVSYRICDFIPLQVKAADVRTLLGLMEEELEDDDIDLPSAYFTLAAKVADLGTYLTATDIKQIQANSAVAIQAALLLLPGLPARYSQSWSSADAEVARSTKLDPNKLAEQLTATLDSLINALTAGDPSAVTTRDIFLVSQRTDPLTGA